MESKLREFAACRKDLVEAFLTAYPTLCQEAAKRLRSLYNPTDYPPLEFVAQQFTLIWQYISFGIEGTLDEVIERVDHAELKASLDVLQTRVTALRVSIEPPASEPEGNEESEEPIPAEAA